MMKPRMRRNLPPRMIRRRGQNRQTGLGTSRGDCRDGTCGDAFPTVGVDRPMAAFTEVSFSRRIQSAAAYKVHRSVDQKLATGRFGSRTAVAKSPRPAESRFVWLGWGLTFVASFARWRLPPRSLAGSGVNRHRRPTIHAEERTVEKLSQANTHAFIL
jgi:hypothetical protein